MDQQNPALPGLCFGASDVRRLIWRLWTLILRDRAKLFQTSSPKPSSSQMADRSQWINSGRNGNRPEWSKAEGDGVSEDETVGRPGADSSRRKSGNAKDQRDISGF